MCNPISGIVLKNGDILCRPELTHNHSELVSIYNLKDDDGINAYSRKWAKFEFSPPTDGDSWEDFSQWALKIDEYDGDGELGWAFEDKLGKKIIRAMKDTLKDALLGTSLHSVTDKLVLIPKGVYDISELRHCNIFAVADGAELRPRIENCTFDRSIIGKACFDSASFTHCVIKYSGFKGTVFNNCGFRLIDFVEDNSMLDIKLDHCSISCCDISWDIEDSSINMTSFDNDRFTVSSVNNSKLLEVSFGMCDLSELELHNCELKAVGADRCFKPNTAPSSLGSKGKISYKLCGK